MSPFNQPPPEDPLIPIAELLGKLIIKSFPHLPKNGECFKRTRFIKTLFQFHKYVGPIKPILCHKCEDGKAFMSVQRCPHSGNLYCYMAVAPDELLFPKEM